MSDEVLVKVENVSKRFCRSFKLSLWYGLKELGSEIVGRRYGVGNSFPATSSEVELRPDEFWAVKDISFELRRGECLGLIGANGAGKTSLLRMLNGLIRPDTGSIEVKGCVGALIALGSGFNPILSGRENVYIAGSIMGLSSSEINQCIDSIIEFAEIGEFIDAPVQSYSSGMSARLGFAVASSMNQDILLLDEILSVGDVAFRNKCYKRLFEMKEKGCSFIFVSHNTLSVRQMCDYAIYMEKGSLVYSGTASECLDRYLLQDQINLNHSSQSIFTHSRSQEAAKCKTIHIKSLKVDNLVSFGGKFVALIELAGLESPTHSHQQLWLQCYLRRNQDQIFEFTIEYSLYDIINSSRSAVGISVACDHLMIPPSSYLFKASIVGKNPKTIVAVTDNLMINVVDSFLPSSNPSISFLADSFKFAPQ
jgi:ABC-type polysaccharide/polyol phosphate transport system ATPase subunit